MSFRRTRHVDISVEAAIETWAAQWMFMTRGVQSIPSLLGRLKDQGPAAGESGKRGQRWAEVYTGDGLIVQRIFQEMRELPRLAVQTYYLRIGRVTHRIKWLGITKDRYFDELDKGEEIIENGIKVLDPRRDTAKSMIPGVLRS